MIFDLTDGEINGKSKQIWEVFMDQENQTPHKRRVRYKGKYPKKFEEKYKELAERASMYVKQEFSEVHFYNQFVSALQEKVVNE